MKPKDLKYPFTWEKRRVHIEDRIWYVPAYYAHYDLFDFPGWNNPVMFGNDKPVKVEYCSGNGSWLIQKAEAFQEFNWVGVEKQFERVRKIWSKIRNSRIDNLMVLCGEAYTATHHYFPNESVDEIFINFPDPWPKDRHAKHRLVQHSFIREIHRSLIPGGIVTLVTDDPDYSTIMQHEMGEFQGFASLFKSPHYVTEMKGYGTSFFEELWRSKGKTIRYHSYVKR